MVNSEQTVSSVIILFANVLGLVYMSGLEAHQDGFCAHRVYT